MQNHYELSSKTLFWNPNMQILTKSRDLVMSGPAKSWFGHVQTWKVVIWTCPDLSKRTSTYFKTAEILLFFEILHLSIFYDKYLLQTIGNTFIFSDFTPFHFYDQYLLQNSGNTFFRFYTFPFFISKFIIF